MVPELQFPPALRRRSQQSLRAVLSRALIRATILTTAPGPNGAGAAGPAVGAGTGGAGEPPTGPMAPA
eukprot:204230-Alexandrium_andersonii.AAC.1